MPNTVASIGVDLTAKIASFEVNMQKATRVMESSQRRMNSSLARIDKGFKSLGRSIGAFVGVAGGALLVRGFENMSKSAIEFGDNLAKQADRIGVGVEALQGLRFAGDRSGISIDKVDAALLRFSKTVGEARLKTGTLFTILNKNDPAFLKQLTGSSGINEALTIMLDRLANTNDALDRNALASAAFGRQAGAAFGAAAGNLQPLADRLQSMGGILENDLARQAEEAQDKLTNLDTVLKVKLNRTVLKNIDGFVAFRSILNDIAITAVKVAASIGTLTDRLGANFRALNNIAPPADASIEQLQAQGARIRKEIDSFTASREKNVGSLNSRIPGIRKAALRNINDFDEEIAKLKENLDRVNSAISNNLSAALGPAAPPPSPPSGGGGGSTAGGGFVFSGKVPDAPALKSAALGAKQYQEQLDRLAPKTRQWQAVSAQAARGISDAFASAIFQGQGLLKTLGALAKQLAARVFSNFLFSKIAPALGIPLPPGFAGGGRASNPFIAGERGPELIVPQGPVSVNNAAATERLLGGGGVVVNQTIAPNFAGNAATREEVLLMGRLTKQAAIDGTIQALRRPRKI